MIGNSDPVTKGLDLALRAEGRDGFADSLSEGYEEAVELFPVPHRYDLPQSELGPGGCLRFDEP